MAAGSGKQPREPKGRCPFGPRSPEFTETLWENLAHLRRECPVAHFDEFGGYWAVSGYEDAWNVLQDWRSFTSADGVAFPRTPDAIPMLPIEIDPPRQRAFRRFLNPSLTPKMLAKHEPTARAIANELIDRFVDRERCDMASEFARPYPANVFFRAILGTDTDQLSELVRWTDLISYEPENTETPEAYRKLAIWIDRLFDRREREGPGRSDLVDAIFTGEIEGVRLTRQEQIQTLMIFIFGGLDTSANTIGNICLHWAGDADLQERFRAKPELLASHLDEFLRFEAPVIMLRRTATRDVELGGQRIGKGEPVLVVFGSANRDETVFEHPERLDFGRDANRHLAFGAGPHRCAGMHVARLQIRVALEQVLARLRDLRLEPGGKVEYLMALSRGPSALPLAFTRASAGGR